MKAEQLTCAKHARILIGKKYCVDCEKDIVLTCLSLDCPERTGGKCNAEEKLWEEIEKHLDVFERLAKK